MIRKSFSFSSVNFVIISVSCFYVFVSVSIVFFLATATNAKLSSSAVTSSAISHCYVTLWNLSSNLLAVNALSSLSFQQFYVCLSLVHLDCICNHNLVTHVCCKFLAMLFFLCVDSSGFVGSIGHKLFFYCFHPFQGKFWHTY